MQIDFCVFYRTDWRLLDAFCALQRLQTLLPGLMFDIS